MGCLKGKNIPTSVLIAVFDTAKIMPPSDSSSNLLIGMRFVHLFAGITWVGLLYFFNLVNAPFLKGLDPAVRGKVFPGLMSRAMWWFRWSSVLTVLMGFGYWNLVVVADAR